jgi:hypothetical protein
MKNIALIVTVVLLAGGVLLFGLLNKPQSEGKKEIEPTLSKQATITRAVTANDKKCIPYSKATFSATGDKKRLLFFH